MPDLFGSTTFAGGTGELATLTRDELVEWAYRKIGITMTDTLLEKAIPSLNLIVREEDLRGTGAAKNLWALYEDSLFLSANGFVYSADEGFANYALDIASASYRDSAGIDTPIKIYTTEQYEAITDKNSPGDPKGVYLKQAVNLLEQLLYVWPSLTSVGTTSEVEGTDTNNYSCIMAHTSDSTNVPITGANWRMYWVQKGSSGSTWVTGTDYTSGQQIRYVYKRPLFDFTGSTDNPDFPAGWTRYFGYRLAHDLAPEHRIPMDQRAWLEREYLKAYEVIFPSMRPIENTHHNKVQYF